MEIIKFPYDIISRPVRSYADIKEAAEELKHFITHDRFKGSGTKPIAIHHSQVSATPWDFFVVHPRFCVGREALFNHRVIINPVITYINRDKIKGEDTVRKVMEGCLSYPWRRAKVMERSMHIRVKYQVPTHLDNFFQEIEEECFGLKAQLFQHECGHSVGECIY